MSLVKNIKEINQQEKESVLEEKAREL